MKICDIVQFNDEIFFNGAVQPEWFYDEKKSKVVACNYIFHGPKYYGVSSKDIGAKHHKLIDTATYADILIKKITTKENNNFILTIAGYGTGKSHLAVCLGELLSARDLSAKQLILENLSNADDEISERISKKLNKKNFVIILNGMQNFNLDSEVLSRVKQILSYDKIDAGFLKSITKSYDIAKTFVDRMFDPFSDVFEKNAKKHNLTLKGTALKTALIEELEKDNNTLEIVNEVYRELNGDSINWERGLSAGDVLFHVQSELCGANKPYNKLIVLFDEFGRYIEYAAANPAIAGDSSLQQVFEAVQNADGNIIFDGFIQNDLSAYLSRMANTSNIVRYVGRYENSEKYYLSSNFETILANAIKKSKDEFDNILNRSLDKYDHYFSGLFNSINRWDQTKTKKSVWTNRGIFNNTIMKGCYPIHPITTWILSNTSNWMQQRSTLAFTNEMFQNISNKNIDKLWLPYVYPIDIVDSSIFNEMLNSEEKGLVQSQYCLLYNEILQKVGDKLSEDELKVLKAVFIVNVAKFRFSGKEDALLAFRYCTGMHEEDVITAAKRLEDFYGVISYDDNSHSYDLIAEANGYNEFKRIIIRNRINLDVSISDMDEELLKELSMYSPIETSFAQEKSISSAEWCFERKIVDADNIDQPYIEGLIERCKIRYLGDEPRGIVMYCYISEDYEKTIMRLTSLYKKCKVDDYPIIMIVVYDEDNMIKSAIKSKVAANKMSSSEKERFQKHLTNYLRKQNKVIVECFSKMVFERKMIDTSGVVNYSGRLSAICSECFGRLYYKAPPFSFDGFQNKTLIQAKKYLTNICIKMFDRTLMNIQSYQALTQNEKNRIKSCLSLGVKDSWQVFDNNCFLIEPQNEIMNEIITTFDSNINEGKPVSIRNLVMQYLEAPYGMNIYSITLFVFYYISLRGNELYCTYSGAKLTPATLSDKIFKAGKVLPNELFRISLEKNTNAEKDLVSELCQKAISCKKIEECGTLRKQLNEVLVHEGISPENQSKVDLARKKLDFGIEIARRNREYYDKASEIINEAKSVFIIHKFYKVFDYLIDFSIPYSKEFNMVSDDDIISKFDLIRSDIDWLIKNKYKKTISQFSCKITQLSQVKNIYKKVSAVLRNNGYDEYAQLTDDRMASLETELVAINKYETSFIELNKDLSICNNIDSFSYKEINDWIKKFEGWISFIDSVKNYPLEELLSIRNKVNNTLEQLNQRKNKIDGLLSTIIQTFDTATSFDEYETVKASIREILEYNPSTEMQRTVLRISKKIESIETEISTLSDDVDELLLKKSTCIDPVVSNEIDKKLGKMKCDENAWVNLYLDNKNDKTIKQMTAEDCSNWLNRTTPLPKFITSVTKNSYSQIKRKIDKRLHECKVDGVVTIFSSLSDEEKKECWKAIKKLMKDE